MSASAAGKIIAGLEDAIAYAQGDESRVTTYCVTEQEPPRALSPKIAAVLDILVEAAVAGERCPTLDGIAYLLEKRGIAPGDAGKAVPGLAGLGLIRIEISGNNYRVVEILTGPHKGARTLGNGIRPHWIIDQTGHRRFRRAVRRP